MIPHIYEKLIDKLVEKTVRREVNWDVTPGGDMLIVKFKEASIAMHRGTNFIDVIIMGKSGDGIDGFRVLNTEAEWNTMDALHTNARSMAPVILQAIKTVQEELEAEGVVGLKEGIL